LMGTPLITTRNLGNIGELFSEQFNLAPGQDNNHMYLYLPASSSGGGGFFYTDNAGANWTWKNYGPVTNNINEGCLKYFNGNLYLAIKASSSVMNC